MASISNTPPAVKAIFSLHVVTAAIALILFLLATGLVATRVKNGRIRSFSAKGSSSDGAFLKTSLATYVFLIPCLFCFTLAYAVLSASVALQIRSSTPVSATVEYSYHYNNQIAGVTQDATHNQSISILSFTNELAAIFFSLFLTGSVWLHSTNLTTNGTGVAAPGLRSRLWNAFILFGILGWGLSTWSRGLRVRGSGQTAMSYSSTISHDRATRVLFIIFRCWNIFSSTSVSIGVIQDYSNLSKNGIPGNASRPLLARFTYVVVPIIFLRNAFILVNIALLYVTVTSWSASSAQAVAFLGIIFGELANLSIVSMITWGTWSMGRSAGAGSGKDESDETSHDDDE